MRRRETLALVKMTTNTHVSPRLPERQPLLLLILMLILVEPSVAAGGLDVQVAAATKEGAQVVHLPDEPAKLTTTTTISTTVDTTPYRCLEDSEFSCSSERRCIPKSWRCDFTEQCLAGEDEFGCLPERCHFERDLCNWQNEPPAAHNKLPLQQAWRRYRRVSGALLSRQQPQSLVSCGADCSPAAPPPTTTVTSPSPIEVIEQRKLARLESLATVSSATTAAAAAGQPGTADAGADYLYVPLSLGGAKLSSGRPPAANDTANQQQQQHNHVLSLSSESTRFRAPLISQTDSRCQLSFGYALWTTAILGSLGISPPPRSSQHKLQLSLHLYLHLHQLHKATNSSNLPPDPIWLSTKHLSVYPQSDQTIGGETSESDWHLARLDIGHVRDAQLSFEAHLTLAPISGGSRRTLVSSSSSEVGDDWAVSGLVALRALEFRNCAWPQGVQPAVQLLQPIADDETPGQSDSTTCSRSDQFRCPSGVCLDKERLCDHLRDCLPDGADEAAHLCSQVPGMEDFESSGSATPGWWTQPEPASAGASFWTIGGSWPTDRLSVQSGPTWAAPHLPRRDHTSLGGSGDSGGGAGGHYLSLDLTTTATTLSGGADDSAAPQRHWLYLNSAPLRWKSPTASRNQQRADCRLKLFYNLAAADGHWPQASVPFKIYIALEHFVLSAHPDRRQRAVLARKLHFLLHSHAESIGPNELDDSSGSGSSSSSSSNNNSNDMSASAAIEAPGVDFWREINHKLVVADDEIKPEELFYARLVVIVEPIKQLQLQFQQHQQSQQQLALTTNTMKQAQPFRATLNIDDLSTHFGCEAVESSSSSSSRGSTSTAAAYSASQQRWYLNSSFDRNDYFQTKQQANLLRFYPPISKRSQRHYSQQLSSTRQFEPHKLVICVVAVLSSIAGLIIIIVFIIVPYVERIAISYHDQLAANQSFVGSSAGLISSSHARPGIDIVTNSSSNHQNNNTTDSDWEQVSKRWRRSTINGIISSESELSVLDSLVGNRQQNLQQQQQSSANSSSPVSSHLTHNDCSSSSLASGTSSSSSSSSSSADNSTVYCGTNSTSAV